MRIAARFLPSVALVLGASVAARPDAGGAPPCHEPLRVTWEPPVPRQGAVFVIRVEGLAADGAPGGTFAGERLHFTADSLGAYRSLAPVPIDAGDSLAVRLGCGGSDTVQTWIRTRGGDYAMERLTVAPAFGRPPTPDVQARIARESARALEVASRAHDTPRLWSEPFAPPRPGRITSGFGHGREFNGAIMSRHLGTDFAGATGAPVRAVNRGVVRIVDRFYYSGNVVYVDHGAGLSSAYLHLSAAAVAAGDTVVRGQVVGRVGATGRVTGPHLHLIVRYGSVSVDPVSVFERTGHRQ